MTAHAWSVLAVYCAALLLLAVYALQRLQGGLPLNPQGLPGVTPDSSFNTAVSFATNTNWQGYGGETTMSHLTQMLGLAVQNFLSAATGIAGVVALIRGFARHGASDIGNAWVGDAPPPPRNSGCPQCVRGGGAGFSAWPSAPR